MAGIEGYSTTPGSNNAASPNGWPEGMAPSGVNDSDRQLAAAIRAEWATTSLTATNTLSIGNNAAGIGSFIHVCSASGKSISSFDTISAGIRRTLIFDTANVLVHDATKLIIPGQASISLTVGDVVQVVSEGSGNWRVTGMSLISGMSPTPPATAGSMIFIATATAAASATVDFASGITSTYDQYVVILTDILPATDGANLLLRVSQDGGGTYKAGASDYQWADTRGDTAATPAGAGNAATTAMQVGFQLSNFSTRIYNGEVRFWNPAGTAKVKCFAHTYTAVPNSGVYTAGNGGGIFVLNTAAINGIRFLMDSGNITSGRFALYGIKKT